MLRRSQLYVPGNNEKMVTKAAALDADSVILDLEDAVPDFQKGEARKLVCKLAEELDWGKRELCVRSNPVGSREFKADLAALRKSRRVQTILIPKAEQGLTSVSRATGKAVIPIIETARGLLNVRAIAQSKGVVALTYGAADFAASVGGSISGYLSNETVKTMIVAAARSQGEEPIDNVFFDLEDSEGFRKQAMGARFLGFAGKQVIHPSQVPLANDVFSPTRGELNWAERVVAEFRGANERRVGAIRVEGQLVDAVHYRLARDLIERERMIRGK